MKLVALHSNRMCDACRESGLIRVEIAVDTHAGEVAWLCRDCLVKALELIGKTMSYNRNAHKRWTNKQEKELHKLLRESTPPVVMAMLLGKSERAIASKMARLRKGRRHEKAATGKYGLLESK